MAWGIIRKLNNYEEMLTALRKKSKLSDEQLLDFISDDSTQSVENLLNNSNLARMRLANLYCYEYIFK